MEGTWEEQTRNIKIEKQSIYDLNLSDLRPLILHLLTLQLLQIVAELRQLLLTPQLRRARAQRPHDRAKEALQLHPVALRERHYAFHDLDCMYLADFCAFLGIFEEGSYFSKAFTPENLDLTVKQMLRLRFLLADLLQLPAGRPLGGYLGQAALQGPLRLSLLLLGGEVEEVILSQEGALQFCLQLHLSLAVLIRISPVFLFFSISFDHFQHIVHSNFITNALLLRRGLDLHRLAPRLLNPLLRNNNILCHIFFSLLLLAEISHRAALQLHQLLLLPPEVPHKVGLRHGDGALNLRMREVLLMNGVIKCKVGRQLRIMKESTAQLHDILCGISEEGNLIDRFFVLLKDLDNLHHIDLYLARPPGMRLHLRPHDLSHLVVSFHRLLISKTISINQRILETDCTFQNQSEFRSSIRPVLSYGGGRGGERGGGKGVRIAE